MTVEKTLILVFNINICRFKFFLSRRFFHLEVAMIFRLVLFVFFTLLVGCGRTEQEKVTDSENNILEPEIKNGFKDVVSGEPFKYKEFLITIDASYETSLYNLYRGREKLFSSTIVRLRFENTSKTKILETPGWYGEGSLEDEHQNKFKTISLEGWQFYEDWQIPDIGIRVNPLTTTSRSLHFQSIPKTSKMFILTLPLEGQVIRCKGNLKSFYNN